jgi:hypothetical protein
MKKLILSLLTIVAIEFNLQWTGIEHQPNWVKAFDEWNNEVEILNQQVQIDDIWYWSAYNLDGNFIASISFWQ